MYMFHLLLTVGLALLPCLPSPSYFRPPRFRSYSSCCLPCPHSLGRVFFLSSCCPPSPRSLGHHPRRIGCAAYSAAPHPCATLPLTVRLLQEPPGSTSSLFLLQWTAARSQLQTPSRSVPLILRWLRTPYGLRLCIYANSLNRPPGLGFSPPAIVPNISRVVNRSLLCLATAAATKSRRLRMFVSTLSQRVILRALAHERVVWSVRSRRSNPMTRKRTWW